MNKHLKTPAIQPEGAAALKAHQPMSTARGVMGVQTKPQPAALARTDPKTKVLAEEDEVSAAHSSEQEGHKQWVVESAEAPVSVLMAQVLEAQVAAGASAGVGGVGAGVTGGVGLAGAAGDSVAGSLGVAGIQTTASFLSIPNRLMLGTAGVVGAVVTTHLFKGDDSAPTVTAAQSFSYPENSAANASVGTVAASDNVAVTGFRFSATNTSTSADGFFSIGANGAVTLTAAGAAAGVASNDFETAPNSFTYGVQARDAAGNWSASTNVTFNLTDLSDTVTIQDDWTNGYDDIAEEWGTTGPLSLSGSPASSGYIEVVGDVDVFSGGDPSVSVQWWNGVYEINVTGQLGAADLNLSLLDGNGFTAQNGGNTLVDFDVQNNDILLSYNANNGPTYVFFKAGYYFNLAVAAKDNLTGSYNLAINFIDDYADQLAPGGDSTADLGFGRISKTQLSGFDQSVRGVINYQGDVDYWKYEQPDGEPDVVRVTATPNVSLQLFDHQGNAVQAIDGSYILYDTTYYIGVTASPSAVVGSAYRLELSQGILLV